MEKARKRGVYGGFEKKRRNEREAQSGAKRLKNGQMFHQMFHHVSPKSRNGETMVKQNWKKYNLKRKKHD